MDKIKSKYPITKANISLIKHFEKLETLDNLKKKDNVIDIKDKKKFNRKNYRKKKYFKKAK